MNTNLPELDKLFRDVETYRTSSQFKDLLDFVKRFPNIAPYNAMLIQIQKPGSLYIATVSGWGRINRTIKVGARPLVILRPFGPVSFVFELSDTEGTEPIPKEILEPYQVKGKLSDKIFNRFINNLKCDGIYYVESDHGTGSAGYIQKNNKKREVKIVSPKKEIWVKVLYEMVVNRNHTNETRFATIAHELGHLYCGHLSTPNPKWWADRSNLTSNEEEFEAESVCWLVCERMGIENPSAKYLSGYLNNNDTIPNISVDTVLKAVATIESMLKGGTKLRKELILRTIELK